MVFQNTGAVPSSNMDHVGRAYLERSDYRIREYIYIYKTIKRKEEETHTP